VIFPTIVDIRCCFSLQGNKECEFAFRDQTFRLLTHFDSLTRSCFRKEQDTPVLQKLWPAGRNAELAVVKQRQKFRIFEFGLCQVAKSAAEDQCEATYKSQVKKYSMLGNYN